MWIRFLAAAALALGLAAAPIIDHADRAAPTDSIAPAAASTARPRRDATGPLVASYGSLPKGITLEGVAQGMPKLTGLQYDKPNNRFIINRTEVYPSPVSQAELVEIVSALRTDDRLGVSLVLGEKTIVYGDLNPRGRAVQTLVAADELLMSVIFGWTERLKGARLPGGYVPRQPEDRQTYSVCYANFTNFRFAKQGKTYRRAGMTMSIHVAPMSNRRAPDGGYLPATAEEFENIEPEDIANRDHIDQNKAAYLAMPRFARAAAIGEAAAFIRFVRDNRIDLGALLKHIR